jgi:integrase
MPRSPNRLRFSIKSLKAIQPQATERLYYDEDCPGLGVRVSPKGKKTFFARIGARRESLNTSSLEEARKQVRGRQNIARVISDADNWTLQQAFDLWMELRSKPKKRTWKRDVARYEQHLKHWAKKRLHKITRADVTILHNRIAEQTGPYAANDTVIFLSSLFNFAERYDFNGRNPCRFIEKFPEQERERYLLPEEFPRWFEAVNELTVTVSRDFFLLALWTGVRREAVLSMRWDQIDLQAKLWRIPNEIDKGKRDLLVYLSDEAMGVLTRRKAHATSDWVLPSPNGSASGHYADPKAAWARVLKLSGITDLRVHDLRRTLGSWMAEGGTSLHIIGQTLGHQSLQTTKIYARLGGASVRNAVNSATEAMKRTLNEKPES